MEAILAKLLCQQKCTEDSKPHTPTQHLRDLLDIQHPKHKDELVEDKVPELVPHVLVLNVLELAEDEGVDEPDHKEEAAACHVQDSLQNGAGNDQGSSFSSSLSLMVELQLNQKKCPQIIKNTNYNGAWIPSNITPH